AEARCGVIPGEAAEEIARRTDVSALDFGLLRQETDVVGYPILPLVHQMTKQCGEAGRYVHWGATTQDIMDTSVVLQIRAALQLIEADIAVLRDILADLSKRYRDTPMAGRTHLQQALPLPSVTRPRYGLRCSIATRGGSASLSGAGCSAPSRG